MAEERLSPQQMRERIEYYSSMLTDKRIKRMQTVLEHRTRYLTVVLEDLFQPHNASAVLRSCDGFGIQDVHIIEKRNRFRPAKTVAMGTSQWLSLHHYRDQEDEDATMKAIDSLRASGYRIVATTPHTDDVDLEELRIEDGPIALLFGTELTGLSEKALANADEYVKIPMYGFVESFNISVSCAIALHHLSLKLRGSGLNYLLDEQQRLELTYKWMRASIKNAHLHDQKS